MEERKMPSKGAYIALTILGFLCGIIWGVIDLVNYLPMSKAIDAGYYDEAWDKAKKIKIWTIVGVIVNIALGIVMTLNGGIQ